MRSSFYKFSLKQRIQTLYIILTILCISITGISSYLFAARSIEKNALQLKQGILQKSVQVMDEHLRHIVVSSYSFMLSETFSEVMKDVQNNNDHKYYQDLSLLQASFDQLKLVEPLIDTAYLATPIGNFFSTKDFPNRDLSFNEVYQSYLRQEGWNTLWIESRQNELFQGKGRALSLLLKPITLSNNFSPNVYMNVSIREQTIRDILEQDLMDHQVQLFLLKKDGAMVIQPQSQQHAFNLEPEFMDRLAGGEAGDFDYTNQQDEQLLVNYSTLTMNEDWVLVSIQSRTDLLQPLQQIRWLIMLIIMLCILVALAFSNVLASALLKPLNKLQRLMVEVEYNDLEVRFESKYEDEVSAVGHKFNRMLEQIQLLIQEVKESEQDKRKSEVKALQAQVDPHFLYNTLNTIFWKSESGENKDVSEMIVSLSLLFRLGLNNGNESTSIEQEIEHVEQYLLLQQKCYENLFTYSIHMGDSSLGSLRLLKIVLQPLVENSILHGFKDKVDVGRIDIKISRQEDLLTLQVIDNGCGMDVERINEHIRDHHITYKSYALANLWSRLHLYYGEAASLTFHSIPDKETTVTLIIPII